MKRTHRGEAVQKELAEYNQELLKRDSDEFTVKRKTEEVNDACDFTGGSHATEVAKCENLDGLCDVRRLILKYFRSILRSILRYFNRSICYRKRLTALYVKEGTQDLLIISCSAELMKLQLASQILPCLYQHVVVIAFIIDINIGNILALIKGERRGEFHISLLLSLGSCIFKMTGKPIWHIIEFDENWA